MAHATGKRHAESVTRYARATHALRKRYALPASAWPDLWLCSGPDLFRPKGARDVILGGAWSDKWAP